MAGLQLFKSLETVCVAIDIDLALWRSLCSLLGSVCSDCVGASSR